MITLSRLLVRQVRAALRRAGIHKDHGTLNSPVAIIADRDGLRIRAYSSAAVLEYHRPGDAAPESMLVPQQFFDDCEGRKDEEVVLEKQKNGGVAAQCREGKAPQLFQYDPQQLTDATLFPARPQGMAGNAPTLLAALAYTAEVTSREPVRYDTDCIQLDGTSGTVVGTDGAQLLIESGFRFPWKTSQLIPASKFCAFAELPRDQQVEVGITGKWFALAVGPWTFWLPLREEGRFPKAADVVRSAEAAVHRCRLSQADADFLALSLPDLPADEALNYPVTIELNGRICVRGKAEGHPEPTELVLSGSVAEGEPALYSFNRKYFVRALKLGLHEFCFFGRGTAVQARSDRRTYVWMPLDEDSIVPGSAQAIRVESQPANGAAAATTPPLRKKTVTKSTTSPADEKPGREEGSTKGSRARRDPQTISCVSPIEQAKALRASLRDTLAKTNELIRTLKRQERQSKVVQTTLASLKQLQSLSA